MDRSRSRINSHASLSRAMRRGCKSLIRLSSSVSQPQHRRKDPIMNLANKYNIAVALKSSETAVLTIVGGGIRYRDF